MVGKVLPWLVQRENTISKNNPFNWNLVNRLRVTRLLSAATECHERFALAGVN